MANLLGLALEIMAAEVIFQKKGHRLPNVVNSQFAGGIGVDLQWKIRLIRLQFIGAGPYGYPFAPVFLNLIQLANPLLKYTNVCGPLDLRAVAH